MIEHLPNYKKQYRMQEIEKYYYTSSLKTEKIYNLEQEVKDLKLKLANEEKNVKRLNGLILDNKEAAINIVSKAGLS